MKHYSLREYLDFVEAFVFLHITKMIILFLPFRWIASRLGQSQYETERVMLERSWWLDVEVAILRASKFCIHESKCYDQALTGKLMLSRRGVASTLYFGLAKDGQALKAHAWLRAGDRVITGRTGIETFTPIAWFGNDFKRIIKGK
jgi:hypothetical protein